MRERTGPRKYINVGPTPVGQNNWSFIICTGLFNCYCLAELESTQRVHTCVDPFLLRDAMRKRGLCCLPVSVCHVGVLYPDG